MELGQIRLESIGGQLLYRLAADAAISTIVESGTFNGGGSTRCIIEGLRTRPGTFSFISVEIDAGMHARALQNLGELPAGVVLLYGRLTSELVHPDEFDDVYFQDCDRDTKCGWYESDRRLMLEAPMVLDLLPETIDLLVLDGGEFSTHGEWKALKSRFRYCFLDDTRQIKCARIIDEVTSRPDIYAIRQDIGEGNGRMLVERIR